MSGESPEVPPSASVGSSADQVADAPANLNTTGGSAINTTGGSTGGSSSALNTTGGSSSSLVHSRSNSRAASPPPGGLSPRNFSSSSNATPSPPAPSSNPEFRRQLQSIRASDLESEHKRWTSAYAQEESFWLKQEERFQLLLKRSALGAQSTRDLLTYLKRSSKLLAGLSENLTGLGSFGAAETGTLRVACMSIDIVRKTTSSYLGELNTRVFGESVRAAAAVAEESGRLHLTIETAGTDMVRQLRSQRRATNEAWLQYYKQIHRARAESTGVKVKSDPYLLAKSYEHELYALQTVEVKFAQLMASLLKDLQAEELRRSTGMKQLLMDNLSAQKAVLEHSVKFTDNALTTVKAIHPEADLQEFVFAADLFITPEGENAMAPVTATTVASVLAAAAAASSVAPAAVPADPPLVAFLSPPPPRDPHSLARVYAHEIEKEGALSRQGGIIKSNWKPMHACLTASGFLHLFDPKDRKAVHSTWALADAQVENGESVHPLAFGLKFTKTGFSLSGSQTVVYFKADNSDELMEWIHACSSHDATTLQHQHPALSAVQQARQEAAASAAAGQEASS